MQLCGQNRIVYFFRAREEELPPPFAPMEKNDYTCSPSKVHIYESSNQRTKIYYLHYVAKRLYAK